MKKKFSILLILFSLLFSLSVLSQAEYTIEKEEIKVMVAEKVALGGKVLVAKGQNVYNVMGRAMYELYYVGCKDNAIYFHVKVQDFLNKNTSNIKPAGSIWEYDLVVPKDKKVVKLNILHLGGEDVKQNPSIELNISHINDNMQLILDEPKNYVAN